MGDPWYIAVVTKGSKELQVCNLLLEFYICCWRLKFDSCNKEQLELWL